MTHVYPVFYMSWCYGNFFVDLMQHHDGFDHLPATRFYNQTKKVWETSSPVCYNENWDECVRLNDTQFEKYIEISNALPYDKIICKCWTHSADMYSDKIKISDVNTIKPVFLTIDDKDSHCYRRMVWGCGEVVDAPDYWNINTNDVMAKMVRRRGLDEIKINIDQILKLNEQEYDYACNVLEIEPWQGWKDYVTEYISLEGNPDV